MVNSFVINSHLFDREKLKLEISLHTSKYVYNVIDLVDYIHHIEVHLLLHTSGCINLEHSIRPSNILFATTTLYYNLSIKYTILCIVLSLCIIITSIIVTNRKKKKKNNNTHNNSSKYYIK